MGDKVSKIQKIVRVCRIVHMVSETRRLDVDPLDSEPELHVIRVYTSAIATNGMIELDDVTPH